MHAQYCSFAKSTRPCDQPEGVELSTSFRIMTRESHIIAIQETAMYKSQTFALWNLIGSIVYVASTRVCSGSMQWETCILVQSCTLHKYGTLQFYWLLYHIHTLQSYLSPRRQHTIVLFFHWSVLCISLGLVFLFSY